VVKKNLNIDLNCDMGEGFEANEASILPYVSSINVSCAAHAGSVIDIHKTLDRAANYPVLIGAHPGYADKPNFGRINLSLSKIELKDLVKRQLDLFFGICQTRNIGVHHVKLHGALYNQTAADTEMAIVIFETIKSFGPTLKIYGLANSCHIDAAEHLSIPYWAEAFIDRTYQAKGILSPRSAPNALIADLSAVLTQAKSIAFNKNVVCVDSTTIKLNADTLCIHGDGPQAIQFAQSVYGLLSAI
jgi:5-oxoprolinase (ATP-hydrolysing) subunit A